MNIKKIITFVVCVIVVASIFVYYQKNKTSEIVNTTSDTYTDYVRGFSITFPNKISSASEVDENTFRIFENKNMNEVKFYIPAAMATGTNLSKDSYLIVEQSPEDLNCNVESFFSYNSSRPFSLLDKGVSYFVATSSEAAAGNRYDQVLYVIKESKPCTAISYFIHSTAFENYKEGTIKKFDKQALIRQFDEIRRSFKKI